MASTEIHIPTPTEATMPAAQLEERVRQRSWVSGLQRAYVPVMSVLLTILIGNWLASVARMNAELGMEERNERVTLLPQAGLSAADLAEAQAVLGTAGAQPNRARLLYLGDSQVFSRPDAPGTLNTPEWLQVLLSRQDERAVRVSIGASPGIDIAEMLLRSAAASEEKPRQDDIIVADLVLAQMRTLAVRGEITPLTAVPAVNSSLRSLIAANPDLADAAQTLNPLLQAPQAGSNEKTDKPLAKKVEDSLQSGAERWSFFGQRENLVRLGLLRQAQWEHRVLHITSDTRIATPEVSYRTNLQLLELLMRYAESQQIHLIVFFGPVRNLQPNPDAPADLARMHRDVTALCQRYPVTCLDYSQALPESFWANYAANQRGAFAMLAGQHDFYHFTEAGHQVLAEKIVSDAGPSILRWSRQAGGEQ